METLVLKAGYDKKSTLTFHKIDNEEEILIEAENAQTDFRAYISKREAAQLIEFLQEQLKA